MRKRPWAVLSGFNGRVRHERDLPYSRARCMLLFCPPWLWLCLQLSHSVYCRCFISVQGQGSFSSAFLSFWKNIYPKASEAFWRNNAVSGIFTNLTLVFGGCMSLYVVLRDWFHPPPTTLMKLVLEAPWGIHLALITLSYLIWSTVQTRVNAEICFQVFVSLWVRFVLFFCFVLKVTDLKNTADWSNSAFIQPHFSWWLNVWCWHT